MSQLVHVVMPNGERYEFDFSDGWGAERILSQLESQKRMFGFNRSVRTKDSTFGDDSPVVDVADPKSGFAFDSPDTVVVIGTVTGDNQFREIRRIKGPPTAEPTQDGAETGPAAS